MIFNGKETINEVLRNCPVSKSYCYGNENRIVVTGSFYLCLMGLATEFEDIDILVVDADKGFWSDLFEMTDNWDIRKYGDYDSIKATIGGITYNLIPDNRYDEYSNIMLDENEGIELDTLKHALKAKAKLGRDKDIKVLADIKRQINEVLTAK